MIKGFFYLGGEDFHEFNSFREFRDFLDTSLVSGLENGDFKDGQALDVQVNYDPLNSIEIKDFARDIVFPGHAKLELRNRLNIEGSHESILTYRLKVSDEYRHGLDTGLELGDGDWIN